MAGTVNKVILLGNVGRDPEIRTLDNGKKLANFTMATTETWKDKTTQERKERVEWHRIVVFNENIVKSVENYVKKGTRLYIEGSLTTRKWVDKDGSERYTTEIVLQNNSSVMVMMDKPVSSTESDDDLPT